MKGLSVLLILTSVGLGEPAQKLLGSVDFFGYKGLDVKAVRDRLRIHEGKEFPGTRTADEWKLDVREEVKQAVGEEPTEVRLVCCDDQGNWMMYVGLPGRSRAKTVYNSPPTGDAQFAPEIVKLHEEIENASRAAVMRGAAREDTSQGFALAGEDTDLRAKQMRLREYALGDESTILRVLESSSDARHRAMAATALGYARQSDKQIARLVKASLDPDEGVRNDSIRALSVLVMAKPDLARQIPADPFIEILSSGTWTDHNKAGFLLNFMSQSRDPSLLKLLRTGAMDALLEMARWRSPGHAFPARMMLGRIAGIEEGRLLELLNSGQVDEVIGAAVAVK